MCNVFSGHVVTEPGKHWGKVLIVTGIHHEKDREHKSVSKFGENIAAWETLTEGDLNSGVKIVHSCGKSIPQKEVVALVEITSNYLKKSGYNSIIKQIVKKSDNVELKGLTITPLPDSLKVENQIYGFKGKKKG